MNGEPSAAVGDSRGDAAPAQDSIIRIPFAAPIRYPGWAQGLKHPELERRGPAEYDLASLRPWTHPGQFDENGVKGSVIYAELVKEGILETCIGLRDLLEIRKKGVVQYRRFFGLSIVYGWKSIVEERVIGEEREPYCLIPYLYVYNDCIIQDWNGIANDWYKAYVAYRHQSH